MRVLHVYKTSLPDSMGGVQQFMHTLCKKSAAIGVSNTIFSLSKKPRPKPIEMEGYRVCQAKQHLFLASTGFSLTAFHQFKKLASEADIIHYYYPNPFADILHFACSPKKPSLVTYQSDIIKQKHLLHLYQPLKKRFLQSVDHIVATSPNYVRSSDTLPDYASKLSVIPIGIETHLYNTPDAERIAYWKQRLKKPFFLFVGVMRYYKGLHTALNAIAGTRIHLAVAGVGGLEQELKAQARSLQLDNIDFLGAVDEADKLALLHLCTGFIFPSHLRTEAFGIALLEAAAAGKPLISCEIGTGTTFINIANETGMVIQPGSVTELREAMLFLLDNPAIATAMGAKAKTRANTLFTADQQACSYYELYQHLLDLKT